MGNKIANTNSWISQRNRIEIEGSNRITGHDDLFIIKVAVNSGSAFDPYIFCFSEYNLKKKGYV